MGGGLPDTGELLGETVRKDLLTYPITLPDNANERTCNGVLFY